MQFCLIPGRGLSLSPVALDIGVELRFRLVSVDSRAAKRGKPGNYAKQDRATASLLLLINGKLTQNSA